MTYSILIDGGGTETRLALAEGRTILRSITMESAKPNVVGVAQSAEMLLAWMQTLCAKEGIAFGSVKHIVIGMAGIWEEEEKQCLLDALRTAANKQIEILPRTLICSDAEIAYRGAFDAQKEQGILLIAGTGAIALRRSKDGVLQRAGGYGVMIGDEGSGAWIGRAALQAILRQLDNRGQDTTLTKMLLARHAEKKYTPREIAALYSSSPSALASLAPLVLEAAAPDRKKKDRISQSILEQAADELLLLIVSLLPNGKSKPLPLVLHGGIATEISMYQRLQKRLKLDTRLQLTEPCGDALEGALGMIP